MKALTLTQPWASLVVLGVKRYETRSWPIPLSLRGGQHRIAIHAAKGWTVDDREFLSDLIRDGVLPQMATATIPRGAVLGTVRLDGIFTTTAALRQNDMTALERELGDYSPGRYAWLLGAPDRFPDPIPARGSLGLWDWYPEGQS